MLWFVSACAYIALDVVITEAKLRKIAERSAEPKRRSRSPARRSPGGRATSPRRSSARPEKIAEENRAPTAALAAATGHRRPLGVTVLVMVCAATWVYLGHRANFAVFIGDT